MTEEHKKKLSLAHKGQGIKHGFSPRGDKNKFYKVWEIIDTR